MICLYDCQKRYGRDSERQSRDRQDTLLNVSGASYATEYSKEESYSNAIAAVLILTSARSFPSRRYKVFFLFIRTVVFRWVHAHDPSPVSFMAIRIVLISAACPMIAPGLLCCRKGFLPFFPFRCALESALLLSIIMEFCLVVNKFV